MQKMKMAMVTDGSGDVEQLCDAPTGECNGYICALRYVKTDYVDGVDVVFSGADSGIVYHTWTDVNATATVFNGDGSFIKKPIASERLKIVVSSGGDTKIGTFHIWIEH